MSSKTEMDTEKRGLVPRLRFPEFRDAGPWEMKRIEEICEKVSQGGTPNTAKREYWNGNIAWITPAEMGNNTTRFIHCTDRKITKLGLKNCPSDLLPINSVILSTRAPIGYLSINKVEMAMNQGCKGLVPNHTTNHDFLYFSLLKHVDELDNLGAGNTFKEIPSSALKKFKVPIPQPTEQQKIADCMSCLDEVIALQAQKLDALKQHKKGLMQQIFPQEGETTPRLRFPEFRDAGPWEMEYGNTLFKQISNKEHNGSLPVLAITQEHGAIPRDMIDYHVSVTEKSLKSYKVVEIGDFIISLRTFQGGIEYSYYKGICSPAYIVLRNTNNRVINEFYKYYFKTGKYIRDLNRNLEGLRDGKMVSYKQFSEIKLPFPSTAEQQKIADILASLDEVIALQAQKLEALKQHKKGLMQQLFPQEVG